MYANCIFCSAGLGRNEVLESFPAGTHIAVDAWRGRLWVVCPACRRWNLAPIEERWEPVEEAEKAFRDAKLRVQTENIGLARLPDGTRLIRIGQAVEGEIAAWRYGRELLRRRHRYLVAGTAVGVGAAAVYFGGLIAAPTLIYGSIFWADHRNQRVVDRITTETGERLVIRRWHVPGIHLGMADDGVALHVRDVRKKRNWSTMSGEVSRDSTDLTLLTGSRAQATLARALLHVNTEGATQAQLDTAARALADAGSAPDLIRHAATGGIALGNRAGRNPTPAERHVALAMEMALHESSERRALEGELGELRKAWLEAEEIAAIADSLPFGLDRLARFARDGLMC